MTTMILQIKKILNLKHILQKTWYIFILFAFSVFLVVVHHEDFWGNLNARNAKTRRLLSSSYKPRFQLLVEILPWGMVVGTPLPHKHHEKVPIFPLMSIYLVWCITYSSRKRKTFLFTAVLAPEYRECRSWSGSWKVSVVFFLIYNSYKVMKEWLMSISQTTKGPLTRIRLDWRVSKAHGPKNIFYFQTKDTFVHACFRINLTPFPPLAKYLYPVQLKLTR